MEFPECLAAAPGAARVRRGDVQGVVARWQADVFDIALMAAFDPALVESVQSRAVVDAFGQHEAETYIAHGQAFAARQRDLPAGRAERQRLAVDAQAFDDCRRWHA